MKKFELTSEFALSLFGVKLFRIKALVKFGDVDAGELGGYIEKEESLDQYGNAWVYGDARVYGNARVKKSTHLFQLGAIGSRNEFTTFFRIKTNQIHVVCGCFFGSIEDFEKVVQERHAGTKHEKTYLLAIELAKSQIELDELTAEELTEE